METIALQCESEFGTVQNTKVEFGSLSSGPPPSIALVIFLVIFLFHFQIMKVQNGNECRVEFGSLSSPLLGPSPSIALVIFLVIFHLIFIFHFKS